MARPVDNEKREKMARDALGVFVRRGVHDTTMKDLAHELGIKRSTLYWYFKDLGEVFDVVFRELNEAFFAFMASAIMDAEDGIDALERLLRAAFAYNHEERETTVVMFQLWAVGQSDEPTRVLETGWQFLAPFRAGLAARIQTDVDAGRARPCDAEALIDTCFAVMHGAMVHQIATRTASDTILDLVIQQLLEPLRIPNPEST